MIMRLQKGYWGYLASHTLRLVSRVLRAQHFEKPKQL